MPLIRCPHCACPLKVPDAMLGQRGRCNRCRKLFLAELPAPHDNDKVIERRIEESAARPAKKNSSFATPPAPPKSSTRGRTVVSGQTPPPAAKAGDLEVEPEAPRKKKRPWVYVEARYPFRLGVLSFAWALLGWLFAALAAHMAFVPLVGVLHILFPLITVGLIAANLYFALRSLWAGSHPFCLLPVTGLQVCLFTTLFFQLFAHGGAELYEISGPTAGWHWVLFSFAHALRASDMFDVVEAYNMKIQTIKHDSALVAAFVLIYHMVIDVFCLGVLWEVIERTKRRMMRDDGIRILVMRGLIGAFAVWLVTWFVVAFPLYHWRFLDLCLWLVDNVLHVLDFPDVMETFGIRLSSLPREGITGTLTFLCRIWIGLGIGLVLGKKKKETGNRALATPPGVPALPYWSRQAGMLAGILAAVVVIAVIGQVALGSPIGRLKAAVEDGPEARAAAALRALRRLGPAAQSVVPELAGMRPRVPEETRDEITKTLGYLGPSAIKPLTEIALHEDESSASLAAESLEQIRSEAAPALARVWSETTSETVRAQADDSLRQLGSDAVPVLMEATTTANAEAHYHWFAELDRNWHLRSTSNKTVKALKKLPDVLRQLEEGGDKDTLVKLLQSLGECGTAANGALPTLLKVAATPKVSVHNETAKALKTLGPRVTPELIKHLGDEDHHVKQTVMAALAAPQMWDENSVKDPSVVPALDRLLHAGSVQYAQDVALNGLRLAGPAARGSVPGLFVLLGHGDPGRRRSVREALAGIDPSWKKHPGNCHAIPDLLPYLSRMPKDERDELIAAMGDLQPGDAQRFVNILTAWVSPRSGKEYQATLFKGLDLLGPHARAAAPLLAGYVKNPTNPQATRMLVASHLKSVDPDTSVDLPALASIKQGDKLPQYLLEKNPSDALTILERNLEAPHVRACMEAFLALIELGPQGKPLVGRVLAHLKDPDVTVARETKERSPGGRPRHEFVSTRSLVLRTLNAIDKDWPGHPEASKALADMVAILPREAPEAQTRILGVLSQAGPAARAAAADLVHVLFNNPKLWTDDARAVLNRMDPDWRKLPEVKSRAWELVAGMETEPASDRRVAILGEAAMPALKKALKTASPDLRARMEALLQEDTPSSKESTPSRKVGIPELLDELEAPMVSLESTRRVLNSLRELDPKWASSPRAREVLPRLLARLASDSQASGTYGAVCAAVGSSVIPEVVRHASTGSLEQRARALAVLGEIGAGSPAAMGAAQEGLKDPDVGVRQQAVKAVGKLGRGNSGLVVILASGLLDEVSTVREQTAQALEEVDSSWRKNMGTHVVLGRAIRNLSYPRAEIRKAALEALDRIGRAEGVIMPLERMLAKEKDPAIRRQGQQLLERLGRTR